MSDSLYIAIDLGAGSGRVFIAGTAPDEFTLEEIHRFSYQPREAEGHLRWDFPKILDDVKTGLLEVGRRSHELGRPIRSIGVDSWGVDYGLIDAHDKLVENPICYRDRRTEQMMRRVFKRVSREEIFEHTGIQFLPFNTLFQLFAHVESGLPEAADKLLMIPDLVGLSLTGKAVIEYTNATTTQMLSAKSRTWDHEMLEQLGLPSRLLGEIVPAGTDLGLMKPALAEELSLDGIPVVAPATHDTGSAVAGTPLRDGWAYISSGTWSLVGVELQSPLINEDVTRHNFTNEGGAFGTIRFLKNVMGLWILESCRKEWKEQGLNIGYGNLLHEAEAIRESPGLIYPDDERLFNPPRMLQAIEQQMTETNQRFPLDAPSLAKVILDSLAFRYASILRTIQLLTNKKIKGVHIVGGSNQNDYLNQTTATVTGLPVIAGPIEATVTGNVLVQAIAAGRFGSMANAREYIAGNLELREFVPRSSRRSDEAAAQYAEIETRYLDQQRAR